MDEKVQHIRILTIHCVECILQWKQQIWRLQGPQECVFSYQGDSYLRKIQLDYEWLRSSKLANLYEFSERNDIFLSTIRSRGLIKSQPASKNLLRRIRLCE